MSDFMESKDMSSNYLTVFPIKASSSLTLDQARDYLLTNMVVYQYLIIKLIYKTCRTKPDIAFMIRQLSRHNSDP